MVSHDRRAALASRNPVHVTCKLRRGLPTLRRKAEYRVLRGAFAKGCERFGFRLVHYSVQGDHLHLIAEAKDRRALSRGMQGLLVRVAKGLNKLWSRKGSVSAVGRLIDVEQKPFTALGFLMALLILAIGTSIWAARLFWG